MRMLVISDLHANWPALEAVLASESHDHLLVVGDLVSYGPHAPEVVEYIRQHATLAVRGNHDEALAHQRDCRCAPASKPLAEATRARHREQLTADQVGFLGGLPATASLTTGGQTLFAVHASPRDHFYRYTLTPSASDVDLAEEVSGVEADYVLLGHTHLPMARRVGQRMLVNPGSVGQPRDGDPRASYAVIEDGDVQLMRAAYDIRRTVRDLAALGLPHDVTDRLTAILKTGAA
jgi:putative phosphoesterase